MEGIGQSEDGWRDPPCEVVDLGTEKGRGLFATRDIPAGHVYFRSQPFAIVVCQEWLRNVCVNCMTFTPTHTMPERCLSECGCTFYCSAACRDADVTRHAIECAWLKKMAAALHGVKHTDTFMFKTQCRFMTILYALKRHHAQNPEKATAENDPSPDARRAVAQAALAAAPTVNDLLSLVSNRAKYEKEIEMMQMWRDVCSMLRRAVPELVDTETDDDILNLICREECNSFGFWDDGEELYAYGLFPHASYFNHACGPNTFKFTQGRDVFFRCIKPVKAGEELFISYILVSDHTELRRKQLLETYQFECMCQRCVAGDVPQEEYLEKHWHGMCSGFLYPAANGGVMCSKCGSVGNKNTTIAPAKLFLPASKLYGIPEPEDETMPFSNDELP